MILEINYFFPTFWKIAVGGFVNHLIKNSGLSSTGQRVALSKFTQNEQQ